MHPTRDALCENIRAQAVELLNTVDLFTGISLGVDYQLWLVESHAEPK
jgi:hypothetical protein